MIGSIALYAGGDNSRISVRILNSPRYFERCASPSSKTEASLPFSWKIAERVFHIRPFPPPENRGQQNGGDSLDFFPFTRHNNNDKGCYIRLFIVFHLIIARLLINFHLNRNQISILSNDTVYIHIYIFIRYNVYHNVYYGGWGGRRKFVDTRV